MIMLELPIIAMPTPTFTPPTWGPKPPGVFGKSLHSYRRASSTPAPADWTSSPLGPWEQDTVKLSQVVESGSSSTLYRFGGRTSEHIHNDNKPGKLSSGNRANTEKETNDAVGDGGRSLEGHSFSSSCTHVPAATGGRETAHAALQL